MKDRLGALRAAGMLSGLQDLAYSGVARHFAVYSFGALFLRGVAFFLIPLYTRVLTTSEFGQLELITTLAAVFDTVCSLGLAQVIFVEYFHVRGSARKELIDGVITLYLIVSGALYLGGGLALLGVGLLTVPEVPTWLIVLALGTTFITFFQTIYFTVLRLSQRAVLLTALQIALGLLLAGMNIVLVYSKRMGVAGVLVSTFVVMGVSVGAAFLHYRRKVGRFRVALSRERALEYIRISVPFVPGALALWLMNGLNRWILYQYTGEHDVGIYSVASRFGNALEPLLVTPFLSAYLPVALRRFSESKFDQNLRIVIPIVIVCAVAAGGVMKFVAYVLVGEPYYDALGLIPWLVLILGTSFLAQFTASYLVYRRRTVVLSLCITAGALTNVALNFLLVPSYGVYGAIAAGLVGYTLWFGLILWSVRHEKHSDGVHDPW